MKSINVLYIDDEAFNLSAFKASFRKEFNIFLANSAAEGVDVLSKEDIHVIITDQRMPKVTGTEFLKQIRDKYPKPIRILLTAYTDLTAVIEAINVGHVFKYLTKPWVQEDMLKSIHEAYKIYCNKEENDYFLYKASHDIKGPLTSMKGLVNLIQENYTKPEEMQNYVNLISNSLVRLEGTIDDLIDMKKINESVVHPVKIGLESVIGDVIENLSQIKNHQKNTFDIQIEEGIEFYSDIHIVSSIVQNIIHNAIKYGNYIQETPEIKIKALNDQGNLKFIVEDNGIGMNEDVRNHIFKMFYRGTTSESGTGLGLYIVKSGLEKINGIIKVESEEGKGTRFEVYLSNMLEEIVMS